MAYDWNIHHRRSIRLQDYNYSQAGAYFITICSHERRCIFGEITSGIMHPNELGELVIAEWQRTSVVRPNVQLDCHIVMPNHFHGIIVIHERVGATRRVAQNIAGASHRLAPTRFRADSLGAIIAQFKSKATKQIRATTGDSIFQVWQRNYYEHVIRNEADLAEKREYIDNNALKWELDEYYRLDR
jgi:putative transposase